MYATVADLRAEGVTPLQADNARLRALIDEATAFIDEVTGRFFEPRALTLRLDGRGTPSLEPPVPPIRLDRVNVDGLEVPLGSESLIFVGAPVAPGFSGARMLLRGGRVFPRGEQNVEATGLWGYTERNGLPAGRTPPAIRRAAMLLVLRWIPYMGDVDAAADARNRWRLVEERTRDQSYRLDRVAVQGHITGDPEIDAALIRYRRPPGLGAA